MNIKINYDKETRRENSHLNLDKSYIIIEKGKLKLYYGIQFQQGYEFTEELPIPQEKKSILKEIVLNESFDLEELTLRQCQNLGIEENYRICFNTFDLPAAIYFYLDNVRYWKFKSYQIKTSIVISILALIVAIISLLLQVS